MLGRAFIRFLDYWLEDLSWWWRRVRFDGTNPTWKASGIKYRPGFETYDQEMGHRGRLRALERQRLARKAAVPVTARPRATVTPIRKKA